MLYLGSCCLCYNGSFTLFPRLPLTQVKEERVLVFLKKQSPNSWYPELEEGLDAYDEEEEEKEKARKAAEEKAKLEEGNQTTELPEEGRDNPVNTKVESVISMATDSETGEGT